MIDWSTVRPVSVVLRRCFVDWDADFLEPFSNGVRKNDRLPCQEIHVQLDNGTEMRLTDPRIVRHHKVVRSGMRVWIDDVEMQYDLDAPLLPSAPSIVEES